MTRSVIRASVVALAVVLAASELPAYLVRVSSAAAEITWNLDSSAPNVVGGKVTYYVDAASSVDVTGPQFAGAVGGAIQSWEDVEGSVIAFTEDAGRPATAKNASDKINRFGFTPGVLPPFAFASAFTATTNNRISDVDVVFNPEMDWSVQFPGDDEKADLQGVAVHEWGHGLGLDHIPLSRSTMFWAASFGAVSLRSPEADDAAAVIHAYPDAEAAASFASVAGDVDIVGAPDDRGVQVTAIDFATGLPAVSALTAADGTYLVEGLPPGVYRLVASHIGTEKRDGGVYSTYWLDAVTTYFPAVRGQDGATDGSTGVVAVEAGDAVSGADFLVSTVDPSGEPNDAFSQAKPLAGGDSVAGRISNSNDHDWFTFSGTAGETVSIQLHARQIGSDLDPRIYLRDAARLQIAISQDISQAYTGADGADLDCRILDFELPDTGTYYVEVEAESSPDTSRPEDYFYVLTLLAGGGTPDPLTSVMTASPAVVPADGASSSTVTFEPRSLTGGLSGEGLDVTFELLADGNADGALSGVTDNGDGTYEAVLTAPASAGSDVVRARVDGTPVSSVTVSWLGAAAFATSDLSASPRRLRPDGTSTSTVTFVPRDAQGLPLGTGHAVVFDVEEGDTAVGPATDGGDGSYAAVATAGTEKGAVGLDVLTNGEDLGQTVHPLVIGFPVADVMDDVLDDLDALLAGASLPPKSVSKVQKARDLLAVAAGEADLLVKGIAKAVKQLEAAAKKGAPVAALASECVEACRELAVDAVAEAGPDADEAKEQAALAKAQAFIDAGDLLVDALKGSKACAKYAGSLKQAAKILP